MLTVTAISYCRNLADKYGSAIIDTPMWLQYLNMAQLEVLNRMTPGSLGGVVNFEQDSNTEQNIAPLIYTVTGTMSATGAVSFTTLDGKLADISGDSATKLFRVVNISIGGSRNVVKFTKGNNIWAYARNVFKVATTTFPRFTIEGGSLAPGYKFYPIDVASTIYFTLIKTPRIMTDIPYNAPEWDDFVMNQVILQAVKLAGVQLREEEVIMDVRNTGFQSAQ